MAGKLPNYDADKEECKRFLSSFREGGNGPFKYMRILQEVANRDSKVVEISLADLNGFGSGTGADLAARATNNARRYTSIFADAVDELMPAPTPEALQRQSLAAADEEDVYDVLMRQRMEHAAAAQRRDNSGMGGGAADAGAQADPRNEIPAILRRRYELRLIPDPKASRVLSVREVKSSMVGRLVTLTGIVTRCTDVKPLLQVATYTCDECGFEIYQEVTSRTFMPLFECPSQRCSTNRTRGQLHLHTRGSKFLKFQEARIQEQPEQVPRGRTPRTMTVHLRGELTRTMAPGDDVRVSGIFLPIPFTGFKAMRAGLTADTFLEATDVQQMKKRFSAYGKGGGDPVEEAEEAERIRQLASEGDVYSRLARSLAPEIYGHDDVKRALLLLLVGSPTLAQADGMKIRGDVHICLMGDPGVAKSQLLKHIVSVAPRGVYTTGKGSSGVGLTAAVTRDPITGEIVLEGGALVLADMGICAIDEFDKMDESDRTAIHEVMEQQTASIAKAGITTSLNARTSVLAAANPAWGRYDMRRTPAENINLPPALLSRFDLLWLILDRADVDMDLALARHVLYVHQHSQPPPVDHAPIDAPTLRAYIAAAREVTPHVPRELTEYIATAYAGMRQEEAQANTPHSYTTARTLLSILRLSQALARLRFSPAVAQSDVDEALRLMAMSKASLLSDETRRSGLDPISHVYSILRDEAARAHTSDVSYADALNWILRKGYGEAELRECLEEYAALNVWQIDADTLAIHFVAN